MKKTISSRMGGRVARKAKRAAVLPDDMKPVKHGQDGGGFKPLKKEDLPQIHESVIQVLENIGMEKAIPSCIDACISVGCKFSENGRILFPRSVVEETLEKAARNITLYGQIPEHDLLLSKQKVFFGTAGAAVHMLDPINRKFRESTSVDLFDIARLCDSLEHIHFFQRSIVLRDIEDVREMDFNTCYASIAGTKKHVGTSFSFPENVEEALRMLHIIAGSEAKWRERPFVSMSCCFVVPPMKFAEDASACLETGVKGGIPILLLSAGQAGATSPASLARCVIQSVAEVLAGLVYVNAIKEGAPAIFGTWPFVSDLRTGAMSGGSGEQAILMAACGQMAQYYKLPSGIAAGMTDSKIPDAQSGYEKGYTVSLAGHSGANLIYESAGMHASLLGCCLESYVIDNDMLGAINRTVRGIEVNSETLSIDPISEVCLSGPGHYLGHEQTLNRMQSDYLYPSVGDRENINNWMDQGATDIVQRARIKVKEILSTHFPNNWDKETDLILRKNFPVKIPKNRMQLKVIK